MENQSKANISKEANRNSKLKQELLEARENASTKSLFVSVCIWSWDGASFLNQSENFAPYPKPVRYETKTKRDLVTRVFPRFEHFAHIHTKFSLVFLNVFLRFDWLYLDASEVLMTCKRVGSLSFSMANSWSRYNLFCSCSSSLASMSFTASVCTNTNTIKQSHINKALADFQQKALSWRFAGLGRFRRDLKPVLLF